MEEKEIKTFKIDGIRVPDKDGNVSGNHIAGYKGSLTITIGQPKKESSRSYSLLFSTKIPDYIHSELNNQAIERFRGGIGTSNVTSNSYREMSKTIKRATLEGLLEYYNEIVDDYLWVMSNKNKPKKKVIFIIFKKGKTKVSTYNGANAGDKVFSRFSYFVGYDNGELLYDINFKTFNTYNDKELLEYKKVEWTEEREFFIRRLTEQLEQAMENVSKYIDQLSDEKILDQLMTSDKKLLG